MDRTGNVDLSVYVDAQVRVRLRCANRTYAGYECYNLKAQPESITLATAACAADDSWGKPHFVLGWLQLCVDEKISLENFKKAVNIDVKYLSIIKSDDECKIHPAIIRELDQKSILRQKV